MLSGLLKTAATDPKLKGLISHVGDPTLSIATIDQARPWAIGALAHHTPLLVVTATGREAEDLTAELKAMWGDQVAWFPACPTNDSHPPPTWPAPARKSSTTSQTCASW